MLVIIQQYKQGYSKNPNLYLLFLQPKTGKLALLQTDKNCKLSNL